MTVYYAILICQLYWYLKTFIINTISVISDVSGYDIDTTTLLNPPSSHISSLYFSNSSDTVPTKSSQSQPMSPNNIYELIMYLYIYYFSYSYIKSINPYLINTREILNQKLLDLLWFT